MGLEKRGVCPEVLIYIAHHASDKFVICNSFELITTPKTSLKSNVVNVTQFS